MTSARPTILIATYLEPEHVERIIDASPGEVLYAPELLPVPTYPNDHGGRRPELNTDDDERWTQMLAAAEIHFDFEWRAPAELLSRAPRLQWVQATSAGIGGFVQRLGLDRSAVVFTTAAGTHALPLAEFALTGALHFVKNVPLMQSNMQRRHWQRHVSGQVAGRRTTVIGLGSIGRRVAALFGALGAHVTGVGRAGSEYDVAPSVRVVTTEELDQVLTATDILVLACPLTPETTNLVNAARVRLLPRGAIVVNIARGQVIDEEALIDGLQQGHLGGAALDVFGVEPLPEDSPLWQLPNVLVSPHSASTAANENEVLTDLFIDNLHRFLDGRPQRNVYRREVGY